MGTVLTARELQTLYMTAGGGAVYISQSEYLESYGRYAIFATVADYYGRGAVGQAAGDRDFAIEQIKLDVGNADYMQRALGYGAQIVRYGVSVRPNGDLVFSVSMQNEDYDFTGNNKYSAASRSGRAEGETRQFASSIVVGFRCALPDLRVADISQQVPMRYRRTRVEGGIYFFTVVTHRRRKLFASPEANVILREAVESVRARHPFETIAQVVLPDHLHAIWRLPEADADFSTRWRLIKSTATRALLGSGLVPAGARVSRERGEQGVWQRRYWEHLIRDEEDMTAHIDYIHLNPVHHGLVAAPIDWPHSTFRTWVAMGLYPADWGSREPAEVPMWGQRHE
ncbi:MAG: transposase [Hyphomicrobiaceae bacterium]|nr:transposase [Hyphomicrobiaceae bacterium]